MTLPMQAAVNNDPDFKSPRVRLEEAIREIGTLLVALAPLDAAFRERRDDSVAGLLLFLAAGATLFVFAVFLEGSRHNERKPR